MTRLAIIAGIIAALLLGLVLALRMPASQGWLADLPVVGGVFEWLGDVVGTHDDRPVELVYRLEHAPSPEALAAMRRSVSPATVALRDGQLVVTATSFDDTMHATEALDRAMRRRSLRVFLVVYQSDELDRIRLALRKDAEAEKLGLSVELDTVGYHVHAKNDVMYVSSEWAARHHCTGHYIEGTGTACAMTAHERLDAYVHGDPDLFIDAHPDALALPAGRAFYVTDAGDSYELEATPIEIAASQLAGVAGAGRMLELALSPDIAAALTARSGPTTELVAEIDPGALRTVTVAKSGLALTIDGAAGLADDLAIASAGLHAIR